MSNLPEWVALDGDPLDAIGGGDRIGYARVSTVGQLLRRQTDALAAAGCRRVFREKLSGRTAERPELRECLEFLQPGDTLVVTELSRLGRSLHDLLAIVASLRKRGIGFTSLHENLDTTTPGGRLVFHVFAALAEFIRELIVEGTHEGLAAARANGVRLGRPPAMTPEQVRHARDLLTNPDNTIGSIAELLGVSRSTIYKYVPDLAEVRAQLKPAPVAAALTTTGTIAVIEPLTEATVPITATTCPGPDCGFTAVTGPDRFQLRRDLAVVWLYADPLAPHGIRIVQHCQHCQPREHLAIVECARCGQGPMLAGQLADQVDGDTPPALVLRRLERAGWRTEPALICADHT
ncbi:recombinase family protein [Actinokineospora enzanensis]|uniref:recombinase family protein n=1 Tax=Actinokineospora enzanensis TaxID=155975 RepID=UPI00036A0C85|nr:recombinase family protein [Actinokineospora enzanensis]